MTGMYARPHPLTIWYRSRKWCLLLLVPFVRVLVFRQAGWDLVFSSSRDVLLAVVLIAYTTARWYTTRYSLHDGLRWRQKLLYEHRLWVMADDAASIEVERTPLMALCSGRRVRINTAGLRRRADATVLMSKKQAARLLPMHGFRRPHQLCSFWAVLLMAASSSNAAVGLLTLVPALQQAARLMGEKPDRFLHLANEVMIEGIPAALQATTNILVAGWALAFLRQWLHFYGFYAGRNGDALHISSGFFTRRDVRIDCHKITTLELRQTLFMRLFGLYTATITAAGYGRESGTRPVLVPAARPKRLCQLLDELLPGFPVCGSCLRPRSSSWFRYLGAPLGWFLAVFAVRLLGFAPILTLWGMIGFGWWLVIRAIGFWRSGFGVSARAVTLRYSRGLALYEVQIPLEVADSIQITRSIFQRFGGTCTVEVHTFGEKRRRHRVMDLPYLPAAALARQLCENVNKFEFWGQTSKEIS